MITVSTKPLRDALAEYDRTQPQRDLMLDEVDNDKDFANYQRECDAALEKVQQAFWEVTKHVNGRHHCALADITFMRKIAELDEVRYRC